MELLKNLEGLSADEQMSAVVELQKAAMKHLEEQKQASIGKSAEMVILGLKKIKSDFEAKFDSLNYDIQTKVANLKDGQQGLQGPKGEQGDRGLDGYQGKDGKSGIDGKDGLDGKDGVSVTDAKIDFDGSLVITLSDGREINVGEVVPVDVAQTIHKIQSGSGGDSQTVLDAIAALQATIATYGTMATQNANNVAITGGTINNTTVGATTPSTGVFTTLTAQTEVLKGTGQNLTIQSQTFANAAWGKSNASITSSTATAPDSTSTACTLIEDTATTLHYINQPARTIVSGTTITLSAYVKANGRNFCALYEGSAGQGKYFNITAGGGGSVLGNFISAPTSAALTYVGNDWYRISIVVTSVSQFTFGIYLSPDGTSFSYTGNGTSGINIWGAQTELGSVLNTYIPTTTTAVYGTPTLSFSGVASIGLQSDGSLYETSAGTGNVRFYTNNIGQEQARVSHTASAVNFVNLTGGATANDAQISALGSDTNIWLQLNGKGSRGVAIGYFTRIGRNFANYFEATGNNASSAPILSVGGSDTNIDLNLTTKGTGAVRFNTGGGLGFRVSEAFLTGTAVNYIDASGRQTGLGPVLSVNGSDTNVRFNITSKGSEAVGIYTNLANQLQFNIAHTASAVNYVQVTGNATGGDSTISAQGSDANTGLIFLTKGSTGLTFRTRGGGTARNAFVMVDNGASSVNYFQSQSSLTGFGPVLSAQGSDTNIPAVVQPKGTGALQAQQTDSTATGGNARGANAVDWQTLRSTNSMVASGAVSVLLGGQNNTSSNYTSFMGAGANNTASGANAAVVAGNANLASGQWSFVGSGAGNASGGYYNFVGSGFTNSGTSASAVTTQSATMNATTAVTLSGSNANIKVGQYIAGTSISQNTYVAAISGTSLTLSQAASGSSTSTLSFFTPHGVVVGGGNNQATGSYSFIGGGGDAGTAANRNVASGDWSGVLGGTKNTASGNHSSVSGGYGAVASGVASFVGGGGLYGDFSVGAFAPNTASGVASSVVGGFNNVSSSNGTAVIGSVESVASGLYSSVFGGSYGTTRGLLGLIVFPANNNPLNTRGGSQAALIVLGVQTTDATATVLRSNTSAAGNTNQVILPNNSAYAFRGTVIANVTGGGNTKAWAIEGAIKRGANAASTALVGTPTVTSGYADAGASTWAITATADTTNGGLAITFTGQASTTIRCVAKLETTEVTF